MPAAHMLAMTWFKSTHRSWYFSCYAGKFLMLYYQYVNNNLIEDINEK